VQIVAAPAVVEKPERHYAGIRVVTPFRGMFAVRDELMKELYGYDLGPGRTFFRLHVVDMAGPMDIEVGVVTDRPVATGRVHPGVLPAGRYATMTYVGHGRRANGTLIDWIRERDLTMDVAEDPAGDRFGCRYEEYLTDPRTERMKTRWQIELGIRLAGASADCRIVAPPSGSCEDHRFSG
jgi:effector-binding domain-containing protein